MKCEATLYEVLEVSPQASASVIKAAYRCLAQLNHPDKNGGTAAASEKLVQLNRAYAVLSDPDKRGRYDQTLGLLLRTSERRGASAGNHTRIKPAGGEASAERAFVFRPLA